MEEIGRAGDSLVSMWRNEWNNIIHRLQSFVKNALKNLKKTSIKPHRFKEGKIFPDWRSSDDGNVLTILFSSKTVLLCHVWERRSNFMRPVPGKHLFIDWAAEGGLWCSSSSADVLWPMTGRWPSGWSVFDLWIIVLRSLNNKRTHWVGSTPFPNNEISLASVMEWQLIWTGTK